jgi:hypothetical protein
MNWAYLAGVVDSDGCITVVSRKRKGHYIPTFEPRIIIANESREWLEEIKAMMPGYVTISAYAGTKVTEGKVYRKNYYHLTVANMQTLKKVLNELLPHLVLKKRQAELMLKYIELRESKRSRKGLRRTQSTISEEELNIVKEIWRLNKESRGRYDENRISTSDLKSKKDEELVNKINKIRELYSEGKSQEEIGRILGMTQSGVSQFMKRYNIPRRSQSERNRLGAIKRWSRARNKKS